jgi:hypothetical protein
LTVDVLQHKKAGIAHCQLPTTRFTTWQPLSTGCRNLVSR